MKNLVTIQSFFGFGIRSVKWLSWSLIPSSSGNNGKVAYLQKILSVPFMEGCNDHLAGLQLKRCSAFCLGTAHIVFESQ